MIKLTTAIFAALQLLAVTSCAADGADQYEQRAAVGTAKVASELLALEREFRSFSEQGRDSREFQAANKQLRIVDGMVIIDAVARVDAVSLLEALQRHGAQNLSAYGRFVSCLFPIDKLHLLEAVEELEFARPAYAATR